MKWRFKASATLTNIPMAILMLVGMFCFGQNSWTKNRLEVRQQALRAYLKNQTKYNADVAFLVDMRVPSNKNRFFVYDFKQDKITDQGLVAHGTGSETGKISELKFSNVDNSLATSLGKYAIGEAYRGRFGKAYKLYGLDESNSQAFARNVVLHSYADMPYQETDTPICNSYGCPMLNQIFYQRIQKIIDKSKGKILLEIYY
jgi:L,D-transpeptidase catalytic domain